MDESSSKPKKHRAPGRSDRIGLSVFELFEMFPDEDSATEWFESARWPEKRACGHCGSVNTTETKNRKPMPYWCSDCRSYFSVRTGTPMQSSKIPLRKWVVGMYLMATSLKGVSSMKLHRDLGIGQKAAWFMSQRIRECWNEFGEPFEGPAEVDETYMGGRESNKHASKKLNAGRGSVGKVPVVGAKDRATGQVRAKAVDGTDAATLSGFVSDSVQPGAEVFTDEWAGYGHLSRLGYGHDRVRHSVGQYVDGMAHTNGIESFWSMLKRGYHGTYHKMSEKHLDRYVKEFSGRHNQRGLHTVQHMEKMARSMTGKVLPYEVLTAEQL